MDPRRISTCVVAGVALFVAACAPAAPPSPTAAPAQPTAAKPAAAPAAASPAASKPAAAQPSPSPAAKPAAAASPSPASALPTFNEQAVADFYRGKTIKIVVGFAPGGGYDTSSRLLAKHMGRYIPGNPNIIVENMTGAGSMVAANHIYKVADKDGTAIGNFNSNLVLQQALKAAGVEFDALKYQWIGAMAHSQTVCAVRTDAGINDFREVMNGKQLLIGSENAGTTTYDMPAVFKGTLGANIKLVPGYEGTAKIRLAVESKEVDALCFSWDSLKSSTGHWFEANPPFAKVLIITGDKTPDHPWLKGVPAAETLAPNEEARQILKAITAPTDMTRPFAVPPEVPADRVAALRVAFAKTIQDKEFLADNEKAKLEQSPALFDEVERTVRVVLSTPPPMLAKLTELLKG